MIQTEFDFDQAEQIKRVVSGIGLHVIEFFELLDDGEQFHAASLNEFVSSRSGGIAAPGSADRVMRELRKRGSISYELVSRSKSLYRKVVQ